MSIKCILCKHNRPAEQKLQTKNDAILLFVKAAGVASISKDTKQISRYFCEKHISLFADHFDFKSKRILSSAINAIISIIIDTKLVLYVDKYSTPWMFNPRETSKQQFIEKIILLEYGQEYFKEYKKYTNMKIPFDHINFIRLNGGGRKQNPSLPNIMQNQKTRDELTQRLLESKIIELTNKQSHIKLESKIREIKQNEIKIATKPPAPSHETMMKETHQMINETKLMLKETKKMTKHVYKEIWETDQMITHTKKLIKSTKELLKN